MFLAIRDSPGVDSSVLPKAARARSSTSIDSATGEDVRAGEDAFERGALDQRRRVVHGVQADVGAVSQERESLGRLGLKGVDLVRRVGRTQIEGAAAREVEPRAPGDALPHGSEVERLHGLRPQPVAAAGARGSFAVLRSLCHDVLNPTGRFYQQAGSGNPAIHSPLRGRGLG